MTEERLISTYSKMNAILIIALSCIFILSLNYCNNVQPSNEFIIEAMNTKLDFLLGEEIDSKDDEMKLRHELLGRLDNVIAKYMEDNRNEVKEIQWLQRTKRVESFFAKFIEVIGDFLWTCWRFIDGALEAYDSIPDVLQSYVHKFLQK